MNKYRIQISFGTDPAFRAHVTWNGEANSATDALIAAKEKFAHDYPRQPASSTRAWLYVACSMRPAWREVAIETERRAASDPGGMTALLRRADAALSGWVDNNVKQLRRDIADALDPKA